MARELPHFSIIIPTRDRPEPLRQCLEALAALDYPAERHESIVVDDGGSKPLDGIVSDFRDRLRIRLIRQDHAGPGAARNTGAEAASGEFLAFTDDDCRPEPGWLRAFAARFETRPDHMLGGCTLNGLTANLFSEASQTLQTWFYDYCDTHRSPLRFFASNNLSLPAAQFRELGGFDTATLRFASEDRELCGRWLAAGRALDPVADAVVRHFHELDAIRFWRQHFAYGRGAYRLRLARARKGFLPLPPDRRWMVESVCRYPLHAPGFRRRLQLGVLAFVTHVANTAGYTYEKRSDRN